MMVCVASWWACSVTHAQISTAWWLLPLKRPATALPKAPMCCTMCDPLQAGRQLAKVRYALRQLCAAPLSPVCELTRHRVATVFEDGETHFRMVSIGVCNQDKSHNSSIGHVEYQLVMLNPGMHNPMWAAWRPAAHTSIAAGGVFNRQFSADVNWEFPGTLGFLLLYTPCVAAALYKAVRYQQSVHGECCNGASATIVCRRCLMMMDRLTLYCLLFSSWLCSASRRHGWAIAGLGHVRVSLQYVGHSQGTPTTLR